MLDKDEPITIEEKLKEVLRAITLKNSVLDFNWGFEYRRAILDEKRCWLIWVCFDRPDTNTGEIGRGRGRTEIIWEGSTISAIVKTCWLLIELMVRHELMEGFRFQEKRIFNPHNSVFDLSEVQLRSCDGGRTP